jgi:peptidyl-prolyl cis-trans isomerase D
MIQFFRDKISGLVVKALLALIAIAFVIGSMDTGSQTTSSKQQAVATVGDAEISPQEFGTAIQRVERMIGDKSALRQFLPQIAQNSLQTLINEKLYAEFARTQGLVLAKSTLQQEIAKTPAFQNEKGQFERTRYMLTLQNLQLTEEQLLNQLRSGLNTKYFSTLFRTTTIVPNVLQEALQTFAGEQRKLSYSLVPFPVVDTASITEADLTTYYEANKNRFVTEEQRNISYVIVDPAVLAKDISITDEQAQKYYDENIALFSTPEKRTVTQLFFDDEADAKTAADLAAKGTAFAEIVKQVPSAKLNDLGEVGKTDLLSELTDAAFQLPEGGVSGVVESPLGLHVLKVSNIKTGNTKAFAEAKAGILETLKKMQAIEKVYAIGSDMEDSVYNGQSLETAAAAKNLAIQKLSGAVFSTKNTSPLLQENPALLEAIFKLDVKQTSGLLDLKNSAVALVQLDSITPSTPKPFADVKAEVAKAVAEQTANGKAREIVQRITKSVAEGKTFAAAVAEAGLQEQQTDFLQRGQKLEALPDTLVTQAFAFSPKKVFTHPTLKGIVVAIVRETKIVPITEEAATNALKDNLQQAIGSDNKQQFETALRTQFPVVVNDAVYDSFFKKAEAE